MNSFFRNLRLNSSARVYFLGVLLMVMIFSGPSISETAVTPVENQSGQPIASGIFRGASTAVRFDVSPPLVEMAANAQDPIVTQTEIPEGDGAPSGQLGPQDRDPIIQSAVGANLIPAPMVSFDGPPNVAGVSPPDPVGDVGPHHYVAMSNLYSAIYDKVGNTLVPPFPNNAIWAGFGGACETNNSGDPIVLYDQLADRWMLTQFTASGAPYFNCVAVSETPDPTSTYYRYAFSSGSAFPDYPKYGVWPDAYYISARETNASAIGAYAVDRAQMLVGNPNPTIIYFQVPLGGTPYNVGDGLLPTDLDGSDLPPVGSPNYFVGSMDDGGQYGAPQDALNIWEFHADFVTPANSTFTLENVVPVAPFDSQFPCTPTSRNCIPQPTTSNRVDILSYRQRPLWRLAYRNFGTHESLVTNQSVEAAPGMAGIRWYELRDPDNAPFIYQQGTYAPGATDGIHRWMGSIAMDQSGNMALGYSASDATSTFPSVWYTGRLASDPLGTMPQGEGSIIDGLGSQLTSARWGDYTSMNVDPVDDCTFWYVNEYYQVSSGNGWQLRIGAFKFDECGPYDFVSSVTPNTQDICAPDDALYTVNIGSTQGYNEIVTLSASGNPGATTASFSANNQAAPYTSTLTIGDTDMAAPGTYDIDVVGTGPTSTHTATVQLNLFDLAPTAPLLFTPDDEAVDVSTTPHFTWSPDSNSSTRLLEVATDAAFNTVVYSTTLSGLTEAHQAANPLDPGTTYYWRVSPSNACGDGGVSEVYEFTTRAVEYCRAPDTNISGGPHLDVLNIGDSGIIADLTFELNLTHSWIGDLQVSLTNLGTGTVVSLIDRPGNPLFGTDGCDDNNFLNFLLQDGSSNGSHDNSCLDLDTTPAYEPDSDWDPIAPLSVFNGEDLNGNWRLSVTDLATGRDTGTLDRWCLLPTIEPNAAPVAAADAYTTTEDIILTISAPGVLGNDTDANNDPLTAVLDSDVSNGTLTLNANGSFSYTPDPGFVGEDSFAYHADDGVASSNVVTVTITVLQKPTLYLPAVLKE